MRRILLCIAVLTALALEVRAADTARVPIADGFEIPVGQNGKSYYRARGVRPNGHLGEDWNGTLGGDTDKGDPIYAAGTGIVVFARDYRMGWGNVVIVRSAYLEGGETKFVDALYGHLLDFNVKIGQIVKRGQLIARMGNNRGMYAAHLHFEMRKNIQVGMFRNSFPRDYSVYWDPTQFITARRSLPGGGRTVSVPINTYPDSPPPLIAGKRIYTPAVPVSRAAVTVAENTFIARSRSHSGGVSRNASAAPEQASTQRQPPARRPEFRVKRFEDMRILGYE